MTEDELKKRDDHYFNMGYLVAIRDIKKLLFISTVGSDPEKIQWSMSILIDEARAKFKGLISKKLYKLLFQPICELNMSSRTMRSLMAVGIGYVCDLVCDPKWASKDGSFIELLKTPNFGKRARDELVNVLAKYNRFP